VLAFWGSAPEGEILSAQMSVYGALLAQKCPHAETGIWYILHSPICDQKRVSARGHFLRQKCAIDRHLSTENFSLWGRPPKSEHLWLNVLLNPPKCTSEFAYQWGTPVTRHTHFRPAYRYDPLLQIVSLLSYTPPSLVRIRAQVAIFL